MTATTDDQAPPEHRERAAQPITLERLDELGSDWPVGLSEICHAFGAKRTAVDMWRWRGNMPEPEPDASIGGRPWWRWGVIRQWAIDNGRLIIDGTEGKLAAPPPRRGRPRKRDTGTDTPTDIAAPDSGENPGTPGDTPPPEVDTAAVTDVLNLGATPDLPDALPAAPIDDEGAVEDPFAERVPS